MTSGEVGESWGDIRKEFDLLVGDGLGEALDAAVFLRCEWDVGELLETCDKRATKAVETVAVGVDGGVLDAVEVVTDFFRSVDAMIEVGDEAGDGPLEVDVVFPEGVVSVDKQSLVGGMAQLLIRTLVCGMIWRFHMLIIKAADGRQLPQWADGCHTWGMSDPVGV